MTKYASQLSIVKLWFRLLLKGWEQTISSDEWSNTQSRPILIPASTEKLAYV